MVGRAPDLSFVFLGGLPPSAEAIEQDVFGRLRDYKVQPTSVDTRDVRRYAELAARNLRGDALAFQEYAESRKIAWRLIARMTHPDVDEPIPPTAAEVQQRMLDRWRTWGVEPTEDDMRGIRRYADLLAALLSLGALLAAEAAEFQALSTQQGARLVDLASRTSPDPAPVTPPP
jgi:hypothetical protein